ncbi:MAG: glutamate--tRNA ligase [Proteobacteria bacterium]|nr:glutamate--tRNA ligase [Pseudomonadota bacterium]MDA0845189.1 glutamate--tRNA ligase [Pseudomonadota bacterium]
MIVVTRFAPSPTGYLHIGGARTALFNWLFARHHGGTYLLRIEDTDKARSTDAAVAAIHDGLNWLGLGGDKPAVSQSAQSQRHAEIAAELVNKGAAYRCFLDDAELQALRAECQATGAPLRSPWRDLDPAGAPDRPFTVRMKMPSDGSTTIEDAVQGAVTIQNKVLDDMVILRGDGSPTYMLAVVVDDHDMGITHVIRGDDHLNNAFRQLMVYRGMGWQAPVFAHIPLIHGSDGAKLSKRHSALGVDAYRDMGFLPDAMVNYLLRLGWGHGDTEFFSREQAIALFSLDNVGKSPARFDLEKLRGVNAHYLQKLDGTALYDLIAPHITPTSASAKDRVIALLPLLKERAKTHLDIVPLLGYLVHDGAPDMTEEAGALLSDDAKSTLLKLANNLSGTNWEKDDLNSQIQRFLEDNALKMRDIGLPLRAAITGTKQSPSIVDIMAVLGEAETLARLRVACK